MATFNKFQPFVEALAKAKINCGTDVFKIMLTNTTPVNTNSVKANITEIGAGNGYTAGGNACTITSAVQTSGTFKLVLADPATWVAAGGTIGPFRWAVLYSDTATNKDLVGYWDYGSSITLGIGETFTADLDATNGVLTIT